MSSTLTSSVCSMESPVQKTRLHIQKHSAAISLLVVFSLFMQINLEQNLEARFQTAFAFVLPEDETIAADNLKSADQILEEITPLTEEQKLASHIITDFDQQAVSDFQPHRKLYFAGEQIPLRDPSVHKRYMAEIDHFKSYRLGTRILMRNAAAWFPTIEAILRKNHMPDDLKYVVAIESGFDVDIKSHKGAGGFWQLLPATARRYKLTVNNEVDERFDPVKATEAACLYFKEANRAFGGNWINSVASYNAGIGAIRGSLRRQKVGSYYDLHINRETSRYVFRILAIKELMTNASYHGFRNYPRGRQDKTLKIKVNETIASIEKFAAEHGTTVNEIKIHNPWLRSHSLTLNSGQYYHIRLPRTPAVLAARQKKIEQEQMAAIEQVEEAENIKASTSSLVVSEEEGTIIERLIKYLLPYYPA